MDSFQKANEALRPNAVTYAKLLSFETNLSGVHLEQCSGFWTSLSHEALAECALVPLVPHAAQQKKCPPWGLDHALPWPPNKFGFKDLSLAAEPDCTKLQAMCQADFETSHVFCSRWLSVLLMVCQRFHICCFTLKCIPILIFDFVHALRSEDLHIFQEVNDCPEICEASGSPGSYKVQGNAGRRINHQLRPEAKYFAAGTCTEPLANASVVPWIPPEEDPITASFIAVYTDPLLPHLLGTDTAKLCSDLNGKIDCLCTPSGHQPLGVLGNLASVVPASKSLVHLQLAMQRRCPAGVPDAMAVTLMVLILLLLVLLLETVWSWRASSPEHGEKNLAWPENIVHLKSALANFKDGCSWLGGFLMSLAALQTGALLVVEKSTDAEVAVWLVATLPAFLSPAAAFFFGFLLCKQQLAHACLEKGRILIDLPRTEYLHKVLFVLLVLYGILVVFLTGLPMAAVAIPALAGPCWTLAKALNTGRLADALQEYVEVDLRKFAEKPQIHEVPWSSLLKASRSGHPPFAKMLAADDSTFQLGDLQWHRHLIRSLTGSSSGFLVVPAFAALVVLSWVITTVHVTSYACSQGELSDLQLTTTDMVHFSPWQPHYEVVLDGSFRQVALQAMSQASNTRSIAFQQPAVAVGVSGDTTNHTVTEKFSAAIVEIQLSQRMVPRVAGVGVQGLRSSLPMTVYKIRFSPLVTLPVLLRITSTGGFTKSIAWSTLPGSVLSVPEGFDEFRFEVYLADFVLGIPEDLKATPSNTLWTAFQPLPDPEEEKCAEHCKHDLNCFTHYVGQRGCFYARGNHQRLEAGQGPAFRPGDNRNVTGILTGCQQRNDSGIKTAAATGFLKFQEVRPDWSSTFASLGFSLNLAIGEQDHDAHTAAIQLQKGSPAPVDALAVLMGSIDSKPTMLNSTAWVDKAGDMTVKISEYDPRKVKELYLLLLPILPDKDFHTLASGLPDAAKEDITLMQTTRKCVVSAYIRGRYAICNFTGYLEDKPLKIPLDAWTGQPKQVVKTQTAPRRPSKWWTNSSQRLSIIFDGVDSPAAWAAYDHGCNLLDKASTAVAASANATCHLLQHQNCTEEVCSLLDKYSLGGKAIITHRGPERPPPLLNPSAMVEVLSCQRGPCTHSHTWFYSKGVLGLVDHSAQFGLMEVLKKAGEPQGLALLTEIYANLVEEDASEESEESEESEDSEDSEYELESEELLKDLPAEIWRLPTVSLDLLLTVANFSESMLASLLVNWVRSTAALPENGAEAFQKLTGELDISLTDPQQLQRVPLLLPFTPNVTKLLVTCSGCPAVPAVWPSWPRAQIQLLNLQHFDLETLPENAFENLTGLEVLVLSTNRLKTLPEKIFQNLKTLKTLGLGQNRLGMLPEKIFQNLNGLETLSLDENHLQTLPEKVFKNLTGLEILDLGKNDLKSLPEMIFEDFSGPAKLHMYLSGNPGLKRPAVCDNGRIKCLLDMTPWLHTKLGL
eukprot:s593_g21.t1